MLDTIMDADHPTRAKLITQFVERREALYQDQASAEAQENLKLVERILEILADQVKPS